PSQAGMHRVTWDLHYQPLDAASPTGLGNQIGGPNLPIAAIGRNTIASPTTPWVAPGTYTVKLTVGSQSFTAPLVVKQDPRVKTPALALQQLYSLSKTLYYGAVDALVASHDAGALRAAIEKVKGQATGAAADALSALDGKLTTLAGGGSDSLGSASAT